MERKINACFKTGCAGNGKTTLLKLVEMLARSKFTMDRTKRVDMSDVLIKWGMKQSTWFGKALVKEKHNIAAGKYVPDRLVIPTFEAFLKQLLDEDTTIEVLLIGGAPRTVPQLHLLELFRHTTVIETVATRLQSDEAVLKRLKENTDEKRIDNIVGETPEARAKLQQLLDERWAAYKNETVPTIAACDNSLCLDRNDNLEDRIRETLLHLQSTHIFEKTFVDKMLRRLRDSAHPVRIRIAEIENSTAMAAPKSTLLKVPQDFPHQVLPFQGLPKQLSAV